MIERLLAQRYLLAKKKNNFINIISYLAITAFVVGSCIVLIVMSVFNGLENMIMDHLVHNINPDIEVKMSTGKFLKIKPAQMEEIRAISEVKELYPVVEETVLLTNEGARQICKIKAIPSDYFTADTTTGVKMSNPMLLEGKTMVVDQSILYNLGVSPAQPWSFVDAYFPNRKYKPLPGQRPMKHLKFDVVGSAANRGSDSYGYAYMSLALAPDILGLQDSYSSLEVRLHSRDQVRMTKKKINQILALDNLQILDAYEQESSTYKLLRVEKFMGFLITVLILLLVLFNLMACIWMIAMEKQQDISILKSMGLGAGAVQRSFLRLGLYYSIIGGGAGLILGTIIVLLQKYVGLVVMSDGLMSTYYPVDLRWTDVLIIAITVLIMGVLAALPGADLAKNVKTDFRRI